MVCVRADGDSREKPGSWRKWDMWEWQTPQSRLILCPCLLTLCSYLDLHTSCHSYLECWSCNSLISKHTGLAWFSFLINTFVLIQKQFTSGCHRKKKYERRLGVDLFDWCLKFIGVKRTANVHSFTHSSVWTRERKIRITPSQMRVCMCVCATSHDPECWHTDLWANPSETPPSLPLPVPACSASCRFISRLVGTLDTLSALRYSTRYTRDYI